MPNKSKLVVDRECLGEALHTALRKCCDSDPTSIMWNLIQLRDGGVWDEYLDHVWLELEVQKRTGKDWAGALRKASLAFERAICEEGLNRKLNMNFVVIMDIVFNQFDDGDWKGYASFLVG